MKRQREELSKKARQLTPNGVRLYPTSQAAKSLSIRSMTLMRWVADRAIPNPANYAITGNGAVQWLWTEEEIERAARFKKWAFTKMTHRGEPPASLRRSVGAPNP